MRRPVLILVLAATALTAAPTALATCGSAVTFDHEVRQARTIWWASVTGANVVGEQLVLNVRVLDVVKGEAPETPNGSVGAVSIFYCGPPLTPKQLRAEEEAWVGTSSLFVGNYRPGYGNFSAFPGVITATGMTPHQQYEKAKADLGITSAPVVVPQAGRWPWALAGLLIVAVAAAFVFGMRRRGHRRTV